MVPEGGLVPESVRGEEDKVRGRSLREDSRGQPGHGGGQGRGVAHGLGPGQPGLAQPEQGAGEGAGGPGVALPLVEHAVGGDRAQGVRQAEADLRLVHDVGYDEGFRVVGAEVGVGLGGEPGSLVLPRGRLQALQALSPAGFEPGIEDR